VTSRIGTRAERESDVTRMTSNSHSSKPEIRISDVEQKLVVYKQTQGKPCSRCKPNLCAKHLSQSEVDSHPGDSASRSIVKARGQDNIFKALEVQTGLSP
jgi:hypothetical protein